MKQSAAKFWSGALVLAIALVWLWSCSSDAEAPGTPPVLGGAGGAEAGADAAGAGGNAGGAAGFCNGITIPFPDHVVGHLATGPAFAVLEHNGFVFLGEGGLLKIYPLADLPALTWKTPRAAEVYVRSVIKDLFAEGTTLYVATLRDIVIIDIADPASPCVLSSWTKENAIFTRVRAKGNLVYALGSVGIALLDATDRTKPNLVGQWKQSVGGLPGSIALKGNLAYVGINRTMQAVDIADPTQPKSVGTPLEVLSTTNGISSIAVKDDKVAFVAEYHTGIYSVDITDPIAPKVLGFLGSATHEEVPAEGAIDANEIAVRGDNVFLSVRWRTGNKVTGFVILGPSPDWSNMTIVGNAPKTIPQAWGYQEGLAVAPPYVIVASSTSGFAVLDISSLTGERPLLSYLNVMGDIYCMKALDNYLYIGPRNGGIWVVDIADPTRPQVVDYLDPPYNRFLGMAYQSPYLFITGAWGGINSIDVTNRAHPTKVLHDVLPGAVAPPLIDGNRFYYQTNESNGGKGFAVVDLTDPTKPTMIQEYPEIKGYSLVKYGSYLLGTTGATIAVIDTTTMTVVDSIPSTAYELQLSGAVVYAAEVNVSETQEDDNAVSTFGVAGTPPKLSLLKRVPTPGWQPAGLALDGTRGYSAAQMGKLLFKAFDFADPANPLDLQLDYPLLARTGAVVVDQKHVYLGTISEATISANGIFVIPKL